MNTPKSLQQYTVPPGLTHRLDQPPETTTRSGRKVIASTRFGQADLTESDESDDDDIEDETYDEIVDVFQNKTQVVKKLNQDILENMNYVMPKDLSEQDFANKVTATNQNSSFHSEARSQNLQKPKQELIENSRLEIALPSGAAENGNKSAVAVEVSSQKVQIALKSDNQNQSHEKQGAENPSVDPDDPGTDTDDDLIT